MPHPIQGPFELMQVQDSHSPGRLLYALGYPLLWIAPVYLWTRQALRRMRSR
jgi:hypothetical protein